MDIKANAFNIAYSGLSPVLKSEVHITSPFEPSNPPKEADRKQFLAIWDTGATNSVITQKVVQDCSLSPISMVKVHTASGEALSNVYLVSIRLPNKVIVPQIRVSEGTIGGDAEVLIGMDIINRGDFAVTNKDGKTNFTFRIPSIECIDFVKQQAPAIQNSNQPHQQVGRNDPCPCGSGKKYKKCHGQ
jgi:predicted aspartyl protease